MFSYVSVHLQGVAIVSGPRSLPRGYSFSGPRSLAGVSLKRTEGTPTGQNSGTQLHRFFQVVLLKSAYLPSIKKIMSKKLYGHFTLLDIFWTFGRCLSVMHTLDLLLVRYLLTF